MRRKVYFLISALGLSLFLSSTTWAWNSFKARVGGQTAVPYQSSNPMVELKSTRNINQQQSNECYLFSFTGAIEMANLNGWNRPLSPEISGEYLFVQKLIAWSQEVLINDSTLDDSFYFLIGGDVHHAIKLSIEAGLLPQDLFKPSRPFAKWNIPVLYQDVREIVKEGRKILASTDDQDIYNQILQLVLNKVRTRISKEAGIQPKDFIWHNRRWDAQKFENAFGIKRNSHIYLMYPESAWNMENPWDLRKALIGMVETFKGAFNYRKATWNQIWLYLTGSIDAGLPVMLSMNWAGSSHVLNVAGYEYNNKNELVSFKLKNTWGEDYGDNGHAFFGLQDLQQHLTAAWGFRGL